MRQSVRYPSALRAAFPCCPPFAVRSPPPFQANRPHGKHLLACDSSLKVLPPVSSSATRTRPLVSILEAEGHQTSSLKASLKDRGHQLQQLASHDLDQTLDRCVLQ